MDFRWKGPLEPYKSIVTENPLEEIWHLIDFFTAEETIAKCNPPVKTELLPFISESITQAQEFQRSAVTSGEHTKALLTYYSMHNLTKAVLALETNRKPPRYHGLGKVEVANDEDFFQTSVEVNGGVFSELLSYKHVKPPTGLRVTIDQLLCRCCYLINEYWLACEKRSAVVIPELEADFMLKSLTLRFPKTSQIAEEGLASRFPKLLEAFDVVGKESDILTFRLKSEVKRGDLQSIQAAIKDVLEISVFPRPSVFLVPSIDPIFYWPQEAYLYALCFILSSLVRYYPEYWHKSVISHKRNRWIIRKITTIVERVYPNLMINIMLNYRVYRFASTPT